MSDNYQMDLSIIDELPELPDWTDAPAVAQFFASLPDRTEDCPPAKSQLISRVGIKFHLLRGDLMITSMPIEGNRQTMSILHGGANAVLAETTGSLAGNYYAGKGRTVVGMNIFVTHHRPGTGNRVYCLAKLEHAGGRLGYYNISIYNEDGKLTASGEHTVCFIDTDRKPTPAS